MVYNRELAKRFVSDLKLPIPIVKEEYFEYYLNLYERDYGSLTKYKELITMISDKFSGNIGLFLEDYYMVRDEIITKTMEGDAFKKFNEMDMNDISIKDKPNITSNNIYNEENHGCFFISVDLKKANFNVLKKIDNDIVLGADTYEDFIGHFTDSEYIKNSKYTREVVFGKMNPKRHITIEKYYITKIYNHIIDEIPSLNGKAVSLSNDEIIFKEDFYDYNNKQTCDDLREKITNIANDFGFPVSVEFFRLYAYNLLFKETESVRKTFYIKDYLHTNGKFKLIAAPLQYHAMIYKLYKNLPLEEIDYHFDYEGMDARFCEEFIVRQLPLKPKFKKGDTIIKYMNTPCRVYNCSDDKELVVTDVLEQHYVLSDGRKRIQETFAWQDYYTKIEHD